MTQNAETAKTRKERKKERKREKKKKKKWRCSSSRPRPPRDPGRNATLVSVSGFFFFLFLFLSSLMNTYSSLMNTYFLLLWFSFPVVLVVFFVFFLDLNRVLETWFPCSCHVEKVPVPHQTWTTHKNRVPKTRFIDPKSSLLDSKC